jgi:outer membrane receptor protein involved in Fe transport
MRGLGIGDTATRTLVLLDGIPMNGPFFGNVYWNRVPKYNVDRIEVVRGSSSSLFGSYAMGGVINIITRSPTDRPQAAVEGRYGTDDTYQVNGFVSAPLSNQLSASLNVNQFDTDGYFELPPSLRGPIDRKTSADAQSLQGQVMYQPRPDLNISIRGNYYNSDQLRDTKLSHNSTEVWYLTSGLRYDLNPGNTLSADFFYGDETFRTDNTTSVPFGTRLSEFVSNAHRTPSDDVGGSLRWSNAFGRVLQDLTVGVDVRRVSGKDDRWVDSAR